MGFYGASCTLAQLNLYVFDGLDRVPICRCFREVLRHHEPNELTPIASGSGWCSQAVASSRTTVHSRTTGSSISKEKMIIERLWRDFFSDPSQWWDHRAEKENPRYPDFVHKETNAGLWLGGKLNPSWVESELAAMPSTSLQEHVFSWNKRLKRYVKAGQYEQALDHFDQMQRESIRPDRFTFSSTIKACAKLQALQEGKRIHSLLLERGYGSDLILNSGLVDMYARCGSIEDAREVFDKIPTRDVAAWNAIILGHVKCGQGRIALELAHEMQTQGVEPDAITFVGMVNACANVAELEEGRQVHEQIVQRGLDSEVFVGSSLIDMYASCGSVDDARAVFDNIPSRDVVCWNAMIQGYLKCAQGQKALDLFPQLQTEGVEPNTATFVGLLKACATENNISEGKRLHEEIAQRGLEWEVIVGNSLINMYSECGRPRQAWRVFNRMPKHNVLSWNAMIEGFLKCGLEAHALELYWEIYKQDIEPDTNTFVAALLACAKLAARREGKRVHESIFRRGLEWVPCVSVGLIQMYAGCRKLANSWTIFNEMPVRDVKSYNAMLHGFVKWSEGKEALQLYERMQLEKVEPDIGTYVEVLDACGIVGALEEGKAVHEQIQARDWESDASLTRSLRRMYAKCERLIQLRTVYDKLPRHDEVSLLTLLQGVGN